MNAADRLAILEDSVYAVGDIIEALSGGDIATSEAAIMLQAHRTRCDLLLGHASQQQAAEWERQAEETRREWRDSTQQREMEMRIEQLKREHGEGGGRS
jgi:hypothetical protein